MKSQDKLTILVFKLKLKMRISLKLTRKEKILVQRKNQQKKFLTILLNLERKKKGMQRS